MVAQTPLEAFNKFLTMADSFGHVLSHSEEEFFDLLDPFLANPDRHREHVRHIVGVAMTASIFQRFRFMRLVARPLIRESKQYLERLNNLRDELTTTVQPGEFSLDVLPSRHQETPADWMSAGLSVHLLEIRVGLMPARPFSVESLSLRVELDATDPVRALDGLPSTEFAEVGEYEAGVTSRGKFVRSRSAEAGIKLSAERAGAGVTIGAGGSRSAEESQEEQISYKIKGKTTVGRVISNAVGRIGLWELLATSDRPLIGAIPFHLTLLAPKTEKSLLVRTRLTASLEGWGPLVQEGVIEVPLNRPTMNGPRKHGRG